MITINCTLGNVAISEEEYHVAKQAADEVPFAHYLYFCASRTYPAIRWTPDEIRMIYVNAALPQLPVNMHIKHQRHNAIIQAHNVLCHKRIKVVADKQKHKRA